MLFVSIHSRFQIYSLFVHYLVFVFPIRKCEEFDLEGLDTTWNDSQAVPVSDEEGDTIPQFDGANDEKPQPGTSSTDSCTEHINLLLSISYCNLVNLNARSKICKIKNKVQISLSFSNTSEIFQNTTEVVLYSPNSYKMGKS